MLGLGQGIFFALGGYAIGMFLQLNSLQPGQLPEFFSLYGVKALPAFWQPFESPLFTLMAFWVIPDPVSYTHLRAQATKANLVWRLLLVKKKQKKAALA